MTGTHNASSCLTPILVQTIYAKMSYNRKHNYVLFIIEVIGKHFKVIIFYCSPFSLNLIILLIATLYLK